jgi:hypothetical protein
LSFDLVVNKTNHQPLIADRFYCLCAK